jgi:hypothetical protein
MKAILGASLVMVLVLALAAPSPRAQGQQPPPAGAQGAPPGGQGGRGPGGPVPAPKNLKVLPKTWTTQQVRALMGTFTESLGVLCTHCHAEDPNGQPGPNGQMPLDYSLDTKKPKEVARQMIQMVMDTNAKYMATVGDTAVPEKVTCFTCHRGENITEKKPAMMPEAGWRRGGFSLLPAGPPTPPGRGRGAN